MDLSKLSDEELDKLYNQTKTVQSTPVNKGMDLSKLSDEELDELYNKTKPKIGELESAGRGAAQGFSLGLSDELTGLVESMFTPKTYEQARDESRANYKAAEEANPMTYAAGELVGGAATMAIPGVGALGTAAKGAVGLAKAGQIAAGSAALGAATSLGYAEGSVQEQLEKTFEGGALGAVVGSMLPVAGKAVGKVAGKVSDVIEKELPTQKRAVYDLFKDSKIRDELTGELISTKQVVNVIGDNNKSVKDVLDTVKSKLSNLSNKEYPKLVKETASKEMVSDVGVSVNGVSDSIMTELEPKILDSQFKKIQSLDEDIQSSVNKALSAEKLEDQAFNLYNIKRELDKKIRTESDSVIKEYMQNVSENGFSEGFGFTKLNKEYRTLRAIENGFENIANIKKDTSVKDVIIDKAKERAISSAVGATAGAIGMGPIGAVVGSIASPLLKEIASSPDAKLLSNYILKVGAVKAKAVLEKITNSRLSEPVKRGLIMKLAEGE